MRLKYICGIINKNYTNIKNVIALLAFVVLIVSCSGKKDLTQIKAGMTETEVVQKIGEPSNKVPMPMGITWWKYGDNSMVVMENGTVSNVVPDIKKSEEDMEKAMKDLDKATQDSK